MYTYIIILVYIFLSGSSRTVMRFLMYDVVSPENLASAEGWSLTATGVAELLSLPFTGK